MAIRTISITGVDGTGKTTLVNKFKDEYRTLPHKLFAFNIAQHFSDENLPHGQRGRAFEVLNRHGDATADAGLKASSLFLIMSLFGDLHAFGKQAFDPEIIVTERQCVVDCLTYARFYLPQLMQILASSHLQTKSYPFEDEQVVVEDWLKTLVKRWSPTSADQSTLKLSDITSYMAQLFQGESTEIIHRLESVFHAEAPQDLVLLIADRETLEHRMRQRRQSGQSMEPHETASILFELQSYLESCAEEYRSKRPGIKIHRFAIDRNTTENSLYTEIKRHLKV